jgi:hypothetical protein
MLRRLLNIASIVCLVGQVVRVSVETVKIVNALPADYAAPRS